jgi:DNA-binding GntR family transcriptional regulator
MPEQIERTMLAAIAEGRLKPGEKLSETQLAEVFNVSRTLVREALMRLDGRHIISVSPRRGWFVNTPSVEEASQVYAARRALESGFLRQLAPLKADQISCLHDHLAREREAIRDDDKQELTYLMGDFHVSLAEVAGSPVMVELTRSLSDRTMLISMCYQSTLHALESHEGHCRIVAALEAGDHEKAARMALRHLDEVEAGLTHDIREEQDPLERLRRALLPHDGAKWSKRENRNHTQQENQNC